MKAISAKQMARLDKLMIRSGISLVMMMENAGILLAKLAKDILKNGTNKKVAILAGKGNNGGGGLVAARHLINSGFDAKVILSADNIKEAPLRQLKILKNMEAPIYNYNNKNSNGKINNKIDDIIKIINDSDLIIDALLGYNATGNPYGSIKELVISANKSKKPVLSLDIPSGLDPDTGKINNPCMRPKWTLTLAMPKKGLLRKQSEKYVGKLYLADIGVPQNIYKNFGFDRNLFFKDSVVRIS